MPAVSDTYMDFAGLVDNQLAVSEEAAPMVDSSDPADPVVVFSIGSAVYEATLFDAETGAVALRYAADGSLVMSGSVPELRTCLEEHGARSGLIDTVIRLLQENPARD